MNPLHSEINPAESGFAAAAPVFSGGQPVPARPKFDRGVSLLCWAYNEEKLIEDFLLKADQILTENVEDYEIVIVDDGSTDQTNQTIRRMQTRIPQLRLVVNDKNLNVGLSARKAVQSAKKEFLFWQTIDWSYDISRLREFLELLKTHDVVLGVRREIKPPSKKHFSRWTNTLQIFVPGYIRKRSDSVSKAVISLVNYLLVRILFRLPVSDCQNVVFYRTRTAQAMTLESRSSFLNPEMLMKAYWSGCSMIEVPIGFIKRTQGEAKGTKLHAVVASVKDVISAWFRWVILGKRGRVVKGRIVRLNSRTNGGEP